MPNSRFALHGKRPSLIHGLCAFFASNSRFMRLFQAALDTPLDSPFFTSLSVHGLHFTVYAPSIHLLRRSLQGPTEISPKIPPNCITRCLVLSAPKSRDSLRLRRRFLPLPKKSREFLRPQDARFPLRRKSLANRDFFCE